MISLSPQLHWNDNGWLAPCGAMEQADPFLSGSVLRAAEKKKGRKSIIVFPDESDEKQNEDDVLTLAERTPPLPPPLFGGQV